MHAHICESPYSLRFNEMQTKIREVVADDSVTLSNLEWASYSDLSMGIADGLRDGRILLTGDVGNPILPNGGQGMNTGISDAFNLGWKLASVLNGGNEQLLDTYASERLRFSSHSRSRSLAAFGTRRSKRLESCVGSFGAVGEFALNRGGEYAIAKTFSQLMLNTRKSELTLEKMSMKGIRAGDRVQDADVTLSTETVRLFELLYAGGWTLLAFTGTSERHATYVQDAMKSLTIAGISKYLVSTNSGVQPSTSTIYDLDQVAHRVWGVRRPTIYLVRPDG